MVPGSAAVVASPGNLLEMRILQLHQGLWSRISRWGPGNLCSNKATRWYWCVLKFENHYLSHFPLPPAPPHPTSPIIISGLVRYQGWAQILPDLPPSKRQPWPNKHDSELLCWFLKMSQTLGGNKSVIWGEQRSLKGTANFGHLSQGISFPGRGHFS